VAGGSPFYWVEHGPDSTRLHTRAFPLRTGVGAGAASHSSLPHAAPHARPQNRPACARLLPLKHLRGWFPRPMAATPVKGCFAGCWRPTPAPPANTASEGDAARLPPPADPATGRGVCDGHRQRPRALRA